MTCYDTERNAINRRQAMKPMNRWMIAAGAAAALLAGGGSARAEAKVGEPAPVFTATDADGKARSLDEFKGSTWSSSGSTPSARS